MWGATTDCYQLPSFIIVGGEGEGNVEGSRVGQEWPLKEGVHEMRIYECCWVLAVGLGVGDASRALLVVISSGVVLAIEGG